MAEAVRINSARDLPWSVRSNLGIGRSRIKLFSRPDGDLISIARRDLNDVKVKLICVIGEKTKSLELTDQEIRRIWLMVKDIRNTTGLDSQEYPNTILEED